MKQLILALFLLLSMIACKENKTEEVAKEPTQMEKVIAVHDEMMPKMGDIGQYINKLEAGLDSTSVDSAKVNAIKELKAANRTMMTWMKDFGQAFTGDEIRNGAELSAEKQKELDKFQKSAEDMKSQMLKALEMAEKAL